MRYSQERNNKISIALMGHLVSDETRLKISLATNGRTPWNKGKINCQTAWNKGLTKETDIRVKKYATKLKGRKRSKIHSIHISQAKKGKHVGWLHTEETKIKMSKNNCRYWLNKLSHLHPTWKGGVTSLRNRLYKTVKYKKFRELVLKRDGCCQLCRSINSLQVHHIEPFSENKKKRFSSENGITLCKECHNTKVNRHEKEYEPLFKHILEPKELKILVRGQS